MRDNKTGFICSSFDIYHPGYALMLKYCKDYCDYLIVGLQDDPSMQRSSKNRPVMSLHSRWLILKSISYIDEIAPYNNENELDNLLEFFRPDVRFLGDDYKGKESLITGPLDNIHFIPRSHSYSSSSLRKAIHKEEEYNLKIQQEIRRGNGVL